MIRAVFIVGLLALTGAALAQSIGGMSGVGSGVGGASGGSSTTPCNASQLDFSDITGCNLAWAGH